MAHFGSENESLKGLNRNCHIGSEDEHNKLCVMFKIKVIKLSVNYETGMANIAESRTKMRNVKIGDNDTHSYLWAKITYCYRYKSPVSGAKYQIQT